MSDANNSDVIPQPPSPVETQRTTRGRFTLNGKGKDGIKLALPIVIQLLVVIGGGIAFYFQMTNSVRADLSDSKHEIIRKVDKAEVKIDDVQEDLAEVKVQQKVMNQEIVDAVRKDRSLDLLDHRVKCHNKKSTKCDPP